MKKFYYRKETVFTFKSITELQQGWSAGHIHVEKVVIRRPHWLFYGHHIYAVTESIVFKKDVLFFFYPDFNAIILPSRLSNISLSHFSSLFNLDSVLFQFLLVSRSCYDGILDLIKSEAFAFYLNNQLI